VDSQANAACGSLLCDTVGETPQWYVAYTYPRHEKSVTQQLSQKLVEVFLPTFNQTSRWKDRRVRIELPLFPNYVFTRISAKDRARVLSVPSVIRILSFRGVPAPVSESEIDAIRFCLERGAILEPHQFIAVGERVRVTAGAFEGLEGIVLRHDNNCKLLVSIGLIHRSVTLKIQAELLETVRPRRADDPLPKRLSLPTTQGGVNRLCA